MGAQHTAGPWFVVTTPRSILSTPYREIKDGPGDTAIVIGEVFAGDEIMDVPDGIAAANARLIAAAPELLAVLQRFVEQARVGSGNKPVTRSARVNCPAGIYHDACAVIARTTADTIIDEQGAAK